MSTPAPESISYLPQDPAAAGSAVGLIGCGGISAMHLTAYRAAGYEVVALCDQDVNRAVARQQEFYPDAIVYADSSELMANPEVDIVDIATHVDVRSKLVEAALRAGKHVLSQKPFVRDLDEGRRLCDLADHLGRRLAVNQNGRWAPHFSYLRGAVGAGLVGRVISADFAVYWPHDQIVADDPNFSTMHDLVLYDFGIHWFDLIATLFADRAPAHRVYSSIGHRPHQAIAVPTQTQTVIEFDDAQATVLFRASSPLAEAGYFRVEGTSGVLTHSGLSLGGSTVTVTNERGTQRVPLQGTWFANGMHGAMGELMRTVEQGRAPSNEARASLPGLALCFAAIQSSRTNLPADPRSITVLPTATQAT